MRIGRRRRVEERGVPESNEMRVARDREGMGNTEYERHRRQVIGSVVRWALVVVWMGVIFGFSAQSKGSLPDFQSEDLIVKKAAHLAEYAILGWLVQRARGDRRAWWQAWLTAILFAATDELHQLVVPGRTARVTDVMIDSVGAGIGVAVALWCPWQRRLTEKHNG